VLEDNRFCDTNETGSTQDRDLPLQFDTYAKYLAETRKYPLLTKEEESEISRRVFDHQDPTAIEKLTLSNLRLVVKIALAYHNAYLNILDLVQEGNVGLLHAVKKYNPYKGTRFSTYASLQIRGYILRYIADSWSLVKIGTSQAQRTLFYRLKGEKQRLEALGIYPSPKLLAKNFGVQEREVENMEKRLSFTDMALDAPIHDGSDETYMDRISADQDVEEIVSERQRTALLSKKLKEFKATLGDRDLYVFDNRVAADEPMSLKEIGVGCGVSLEWVRQVEIRIIKRFKTHCQESLPALGLQNAKANLGATKQAM
jgi:RNA polymerase sigma-32 factor